MRMVDLSAGAEDGAPPDRRLRAELRALIDGEERSEIWAVAPLESAEMHLVAVPESGRREGGEIAYWAVQEARPFEEDGVVFDYQTVRPAAPNPEAGGAGAASGDGDAAPMTGVLGFTAERSEIDAVRRRFADAGFPLTGLCPYPLAFQNLIQAGAVPNADRAMCRLHIAETHTRIDVFSGSGSLGLSRTIRSCVSSMVDVLRARLGGAIQPGGGEKVFTPVDRASARDAFQAMLEDRVPETGPAAGMTPDALLEMVAKPLQRLVWQVERTIEAYASKVDGDPVSVLCVAGDVSRSARFRTHLARQIELPVTVRSDAELTRPGSLWPGDLSDGSQPDFSQFEPAIGIALSRLDETPNFVFSFQDKIRRIKGRRVRRGIWAFLFCCTLAAAGGFFWQRSEVREGEAAVRNLERALARRIDVQDGIRVDRPLIEIQVERLKKERAAVRDIAARYRMPALVGAVTAPAPASLNFSRLRVALPAPGDAAVRTDRPSPAAGGGPPDAGVVAEGHMIGTPEQSEGDLLRYVAGLKGSALFSRTTVQRKSRVAFQGDPALRFVLRLELAEAAAP